MIKTSAKPPNSVNTKVQRSKEMAAFEIIGMLVVAVIIVLGLWKYTEVFGPKVINDLTHPHDHEKPKTDIGG